MKCVSIVGAQQMNLTSWRLYARRKPKNCQRQSLFPKEVLKSRFLFGQKMCPNLYALEHSARNVTVPCLTGSISRNRHCDDA